MFDSWRRPPPRRSGFENSVSKKTWAIIALGCIIAFFGLIGFLIYLWQRVGTVTGGG